MIGATGDDDNGSLSGSAYVFRYDGAAWVEEVKLTASDGAAGDVFGGSVAVAGDTAVIGARADDDNGSDSGSAYVFAVPEPSARALHAIALAALASLGRQARWRRACHV